MSEQQRPSPYPEPWRSSRPSDETQQLPLVTDGPPYEPPFSDPSGQDPGGEAAAPRSAAVPVLAVVLACALLAAGLFAFLALSASSRLDRARLDLAASRQQADAVGRQLDRVRHDLEAAQAEVEAERQRADAAEGDLTAAQQAAATQQQLIGDMRTCLDGVMLSMQALSQNDPARAQAELQRVQPSCDRAYQQAASLDA